MAYNNTIFRQMLQLISRLEFQSIVNRHKGDYRIRKLTCWTQFVHLLLQADGLLPAFLHITDGKVHDSRAAKDINVPPESFLVFDKAYHDFNQYKCYKDNKIQFIIRIKTSAAYRIIRNRKIAKNSDVISDEIIEFTGYATHNKYPYPLRKIIYFDKKNDRHLIFLTNNFTLSATTIADIYKARWEIELFFKTIKQNLKIKSFMGTSKNAVLTQIWIAMIAYLLLSYHKSILKSKYSIQTLVRLIQVNLFERKSLKELICFGGYRPPGTLEILQYSLFNS